MNFEYLTILFSVFLSFLISGILFLVVSALVFSKKEVEKVSAYECGFHSFEDTRQRFNVRYYLVSILFIIFDLEVIFLFPWLIALRNLGVCFFVMIFFLLILIIGFFYEWIKGALIWE